MQEQGFCEFEKSSIKKKSVSPKRPEKGRESTPSSSLKAKK